MKYLKEYKDFFSSIKDPLEKLDELQVELDGLEIASDQIFGNYQLGGIPEDEYKSLSKEINSFFEWGKDEISILESECADLNKKRKKKAWQGHDRLPFPVVWNRKSYNKVVPEINNKGRKSQWIEWLLKNLTEGEDDHWQYEDRVLNAAELDIAYYLNFLEGSFSVSSSCSRINNDFVDFLFTAQRVSELKRGQSRKAARPSSPYKKEYNELDKLIIRTLQKRVKNNEPTIWNFVLRALRENTSKGQTVEIRDVPTKDDTMAPGILLYVEGYPDPIQKLLQSTFKKKLSQFRKLLLLE